MGRRKLTEAGEQYKAYALLTEFAGMTPKEAKEAAGFPETLTVSALNQTVSAKIAKKSVAEQREILQKHMPGCSFTDTVTRIVTRATNPDVDDDVQTRNDKLLIDVMGFGTPKEVNVNTTSLIMEFSQLASGDIEALLAEDAEYEEASDEAYDILGDL